MATVNEMSSANVQGAVSAGNLGWEDELKKLRDGFIDLNEKRKNLTKNLVGWEKVERLKLLNSLAKLELEHEKTMMELRAKKLESLSKQRRRAYLDLVEEEAKKELAQLEKRAREEAAIKLKYEKALYNTKDKLSKELLKKELKREEERAKRNRESDKAQAKMAANGAVVGAGTSLGMGSLFTALKSTLKGDKLGAADAMSDAKSTFEAVGKALSSTLDLAGKEIGDALTDAGKAMAGKLAGKAMESVDESIKLLSGRLSKIMARLQNSGESFTEINARMGVTLAASPFVKYTDMLDKVEELIDKGVAYNVEQRAFLASISDKIASTFDAFDANLLQIIRILLEDSTKQRLGMEASLTKFLNSRYQDTSYLSGAHDDVTKALTASIVQLGTAKGAEFEYNVLKWFGSLSALGMDDSTLTGLAGALEALSTGDVSTLAGSQYLNLLVMAANQAGMSYADILTHGLNAESVNSLLANIVAYWSGIAGEANLVVKKQYAELFGLSMTDMTAIRNITQADLDVISKLNLSYSGMSWELAGLMALIPFRMHVSEMLDNVLSNVMTGIGMNIASSPGAAATWSINKFIKDNTGGINIPAITAMVMGTGTGFDINTDVNSLILLGMVGVSTLGQVGKVIAGLGGLGGLNLSYWGAGLYTRHGLGLGSVVSGVTASTSQTTFIGNSDSSSMYLSTLNKAYNDERITEVKAQSDESVSKQQDQMKNIEDSVVHIYDLLANVFTGSALRVYVEDYGLTSTFGGS